MYLLPGGGTPYAQGTAGVPTSWVRFSPKTQEKGCVFSRQNARERVCLSWCTSSIMNLQRKQKVFHKKLQEKGCLFQKKEKKLQEKGYGFGDRVGTPAYKN